MKSLSESRNPLLANEEKWDEDEEESEEGSLGEWNLRALGHLRAVSDQNGLVVLRGVKNKNNTAKALLPVLI